MSVKAQESLVLISDWSHSEVMALINAYSDHTSEMDSHLIKKVEVWGKISTDLAKEGVKKSASVCEKKWNNLKIRYKNIMINIFVVYIQVHM